MDLSLARFFEGKHMSHDYSLFQRYAPTLRSSGDKATCILGNENGYTVNYIPFEYVNAEARLILVGITPGPKQIKCAYRTAQRLLSSIDSRSSTEILCEVKRTCAFAGMRDRINEMLNHFGIPPRVGATSADSLWETDFGLFNTASVVPNAAFRNGAYFNGPFSAVLESPLLRSQFEKAFVPAIERITKKALYIAMGPVVDEALAWCAARGVLQEHQVLGYFPHASGASGSQFAYFMRKKRLTDLKPKDPIRHRVRDLDAAYERIVENLRSLQK
jgi:hypothetical protein